MLFKRLVTNAGTLWTDYVNHEFAKLISKNEMRIEMFEHYLQQDYLYLICYRKCYEHLAEYADDAKVKEFFKRNAVNNIEKDLAIQFNVDTTDIKATYQTNNYTCYLYECLATMSSLEKLICLAPCTIGYGVLGEYITSLPKLDDNPYQIWINTYGSEEYKSVFKEYIELINNYEVSDEEFEKLSKIFNEVCRLEIEFFNQVLSIAKPTVLTIAGSDSSGGAGIQADIKSISANGGYAASVITAITAQNTKGVNSVLEINHEIIISQMDAVFSDLKVSAIKIGMLGTSSVVNVVSSNLPDNVKIILDPVMVAKDNTLLLSVSAIDCLVQKLFPKAYLVTPNIEEVNQILGVNITNEEEMKKACVELHKLGAENVLIKGGHLVDEDLVDVLYFNEQFYTYYQKRINTIHTHGTGCSLSSAIATNVAKGQELNVAVKNAIDYVYAGILFNYEIGNGKSPINHFHSKGGYYE